jgi:hypothetical protein
MHWMVGEGECKFNQNGSVASTSTVVRLGWGAKEGSLGEIFCFLIGRTHQRFLPVL